VTVGRRRREEVKSGNSEGGLAVVVESVLVEVEEVGLVVLVEVVGERVLKYEVIKCDIFFKKRWVQKGEGD
jgi:altronate dehydratase